MAVFTGTHINRLDKKGRVSVPASFRAQLAGQSFQGIVCYRSFTAPALEGMDFARLEQFAEAADGLAAFSEEQERLNSLIFADCRQLAWDAEGRIMLPEDLVSFATLGETVAFVGKGRTFQLWEPAAHEATMAEMRRLAAESRPTLNLRSLPGGGS